MPKCVCLDNMDFQTRVPSWPVASSVNREDGENPSRTRRCNRGRSPLTPPRLGCKSWEGLGGGRTGSQKTCPIVYSMMVPSRTGDISWRSLPLISARRSLGRIPLRSTRTFARPPQNLRAVVGPILELSPRRRSAFLRADGACGGMGSRWSDYRPSSLENNSQGRELGMSRKHVVKQDRKSVV